MGETDFPGGKGEFRIEYTTKQFFGISLDIPVIKKGGEETFGPYTPGAMGRDFALCFGKINAKDNTPVKLLDKHGQERLGSLGEIFVETRTDVYSYWILVVSIITLLLLIIFSALQLAR